MKQNEKMIFAVNSTKNYINKILATKDILIIAVDGPCGSGKTTFADALSKEFECNIIHVDNFFLQPHQRTQERLNTPGGNLDRERLAKEVLTPLKNSETFSYRPYDCKIGELAEEIKITPMKLNIIEGSYSCHPELCDFYDLRIFIETEKSTQLERLKNRNKKFFNRFLTEWIPLEELYFSHFDIKKRCELQFTL